MPRSTNVSVRSSPQRRHTGNRAIPQQTTGGGRLIHASPARDGTTATRGDVDRLPVVRGRRLAEGGAVLRERGERGGDPAAVPAVCKLLHRPQRVRDAFRGEQ